MYIVQHYVKHYKKVTDTSTSLCSNIHVHVLYSPIQTSCLSLSLRRCPAPGDRLLKEEQTKHYIINCRAKHIN